MSRKSSSVARPLDGLQVVDFGQFLAGPVASLKLLDMGARVIKVENPDGGDLCRSHYVSDARIGTDSTLFHAINRGKESIALDLKSNEDLSIAHALVAKADIVIQNFRPGVIERLGLGYGAVRQMKPDVIYGTISGYGDEGCWAHLPGQDLLAQARSGIMWLSGNDGDGPVPIGLPLADLSAGTTLATALLGALFRRARTGEGALVETSLLEAAADVQFEMLTTYLNNGRRALKRLSSGSAHGYLSAPYGVFRTSDGYLALAMTPLGNLANVLGDPEIAKHDDPASSGFDRREQIHSRIEDHLRNRPAAVWEAEFCSRGIWCARVLTWDEMMETDTFRSLELVKTICEAAGAPSHFLRAPFKLDGDRPDVHGIGPALDADGLRIRTEIGRA